MLIQAIKDTFATVDNYRLAKFEAGKFYDLRETAACRLVARKEAVYVEQTTNEVISL